MPPFRLLLIVVLLLLIAGMWYLADRIAGLESAQGLSDLNCSDGQTVIFDEGADLWACDDRPGGASGFVLTDSNDNEIGPVLGVGHDYVVVALTLPDEAGTQHTVLVNSRLNHFERWGGMAPPLQCTSRRMGATESPISLRDRHPTFLATMSNQPQRTRSGF